MRYVYSIVRFVPDSARGEFINVGAIAGSDQNSDWKVRRVSNPRRAEYIDERNTLKTVWRFLNRIRQDGELSEARLKQLFVDHRNIVQLSPPTPMVASSAEEALDNIFEDLILDPPTRPRRKVQNRQAARAVVRSAFKDRIEADNLHEGVTLQTNHHNEEVDFAITDGRVVQLTHAWSFRVTNYERLATLVKAWGYAIDNLRDHGGSISTDETTFEVSKDVDIRAIYVEPEARESHPALEDALQVFKDLNVPLSPIDEADQISRKALELLDLG